MSADDTPPGAGDGAGQGPPALPEDLVGKCEELARERQHAELVELAAAAGFSAARTADEARSRARVWFLVGEAHKALRRFEEARICLQSALSWQPRNRWAAVSLAETLGMLEELDDGTRLLELLLVAAPEDLRLLRRAMRFFRRHGDDERFTRCFREVVRRAADDHLPWLEMARTRRGQGRLDEARNAYHMAVRLFPNDAADLRVEAAEVGYDPDVYWELRYQSSQGARTPVRTREQGEDEWAAALERDEDFIRERLGAHLDGKVACGLEAGCGSGRLTHVYAEFCEALTCVDVSATAVEFCREQTADLPVAEYRCANLARLEDPDGCYDLVADFTCVQHVADPEEWAAVLGQYARVLGEGGVLFLFEDVVSGQDAGTFHLAAMTADDYARILSEHGLEIVEQRMATEEHLEIVARKVGAGSPEDAEN